MHALFVALNLYLGWKCARAVEMVFWVFRSFCVVHARTSTNVQGRHTLLSPSTFTSGVRTPWRQRTDGLKVVLGLMFGVVSALCLMAFRRVFRVA